MSGASTQYKTLDYDVFARTQAPDDFWGQVRRTVGGKRVDEEEIGLIVGAIRQALACRPADVVLDLACGDGALSER